MIRPLYSLGIHAYGFALRLAAGFVPKAKLMVQGRKQHLAKVPSGKKCIWIHAASLGEFEQGRPLIEALKKKDPELYIHLTFFSPSGYEVRKNYDGADSISYLPLDTPGKVKGFLDNLQPDLAIFIKYEYWYNYIHQLHKRSIPLLMVSAIFRPQQIFFKPYGAWFRKQLQKISWFYLQKDGHSAQLLGSLKGIQGMEEAGDTRFDRVYELAQSPQSFPEIENFANGLPLLIAGSTWPKDEELLAKAFGKLKGKCKMVVAPHEIHEGHLSELEKLMSDFRCIRHSTCTNEHKEAEILIIDSIGKLMHLYQYGKWAYIGGGFGSGIHNILEASTFGLPTIIGPKHRKFNEAVQLVRLGGAFSIYNEQELLDCWQNLVQDKGYSDAASAQCLSYTQQERGAVNVILNSSFVKNLTSR